jgi:branched-chain amino acid aminotransferase
LHLRADPAAPRIFEGAVSGIAIVNGKLVDPVAPAVSVFDAAVLHGDAYFETLRTYDGRPALLGAHLKRLEESMTYSGFAQPPSAQLLAEEVAAAINEFSEGEVVVRISVSRGVRELGLTAEPESTTRIVTAKLVESSKAGIDATVSYGQAPGYSYTRKSTNYQRNIELLTAARSLGCDEVLIVDDGELIEAATSNVFLVSGDELITPDLRRCLPGITRAAVLSLAAGNGLTPVERVVSVPEIAAADEVFLTNSLVELRRVTHINKAKLPGRAEGLVRELRESLVEHYRQEGA